jgi:hypothetical protein
MAGIRSIANQDSFRAFYLACAPPSGARKVVSAESGYGNLPFGSYPNRADAIYYVLFARFM